MCSRIFFGAAYERLVIRFEALARFRVLLIAEFRYAFRLQYAGVMAMPTNALMIAVQSLRVSIISSS